MSKPPPGSRAEELWESFKLYYRDNPRVWDLFVRFTHEAIEAGHDSYSADAIVHRIRWHTSVETKGDDFKINNNYVTYYARLFMHRFPEHTGFFRVRQRVSEHVPAWSSL